MLNPNITKLMKHQIKFIEALTIKNAGYSYKKTYFSVI